MAALPPPASHLDLFVHEAHVIPHLLAVELDQRLLEVLGRLVCDWWEVVWCAIGAIEKRRNFSVMWRGGRVAIPGIDRLLVVSVARGCLSSRL